MKKEIISLTSMRFFAAFFVFVFHARGLLPVPIDETTLFFSRGYLWVDFFFVLSGFVLSYNYFNQYYGGTFNYKMFLVARFGRIYPVHIVTMLGAIAAYGVASLIGISPTSPDDQSGSLKTVPAQLLMIHAWGVHDFKSLNEPSWSISAEWLAYLLFPIYCWIAAKFTSPYRFVAASACAFLAMYMATTYWGADRLTNLTTLGAVRILPEFLLGVALYFVFRKLVSGNSRLPPLVPQLSLALSLTLMHFGVADWSIVLSFSVLIVSLAAYEGRGTSDLAWLRHKALKYGGEISYSIYMIHGLILLVALAVIKMFGMSDLARWVVTCVSAVVLVGISIASYEIVEVRCRRLIIGLGKRRWAQLPVSTKPQVKQS